MGGNPARCSHAFRSDAAPCRGWPVNVAEILTSVRLRAVRAAELAAKAIENIIDASVTPQDRAQRRRVTKGPTDRIDLPKVKGK